MVVRTSERLRLLTADYRYGLLYSGVSSLLLLIPATMYSSIFAFFFFLCLPVFIRDTYSYSLVIRHYCTLTRAILSLYMQIIRLRWHWKPQPGTEFSQTSRLIRFCTLYRGSLYRVRTPDSYLTGRWTHLHAMTQDWQEPKHLLGLSRSKTPTQGQEEGKNIAKLSPIWQTDRQKDGQTSKQW